MAQVSFFFIALTDSTIGNVSLEREAARNIYSIIDNDRGVVFDATAGNYDAGSSNSFGNLADKRSGC